MNQEVD